MENKVELNIDSLSENIALARVTVASFASQLNFTIAELEELKVVISEAVSNSIIHAYGEEQRGRIEIKMKIYNGQLKVVIQDYGSGIEDIDTALEPREYESERMGLGFSFIDSFMDKFRIESTPQEGTKLILSKFPERKEEQVN